MVKKILLSIIFCSNTIFQFSQEKRSIEEMFSRPEIMPVKNDLCSFVLDKIVYPQSAINDTIQGVVLIDFYVEIDGKTSSHEVVRGVRDDLNNEALKVAKLLNFDEPAYTRGIPVKTTYIFLISFLLDYDLLRLTYTPKIVCSDILKKITDERSSSSSEDAPSADVPIPRLDHQTCKDG